ncbi:MAG: class I SAM-dependent methyltransferase, partial [Oligoflexia bacterium]|nr:class I SAM-dependent methyltransferase [Oligoflexia bacterium]
FFLEMLLNLPSGVLIGIHDIFLPFDYPETWRDRLYSEQYMLAMTILANPSRFRILLPGQFVIAKDSYNDSMRDFWARIPENLDRGACSFWFES